MSKLPYRVHLVPIIGKSFETNQWACGSCLKVCSDFDAAKKCCAAEAGVKEFDKLPKEALATAKKAQELTKELKIKNLTSAILDSTSGSRK